MSNEQELLILRARIKELETRLDFLYRKLGVEYVDNPGLADSRIIALVKSGKKLEAIKMYRELTNSDLTEAKQAVDQIENNIT